MAGSVNKVILVGKLGRDPDSRTTQAGAKVVNLSIATSERWKDRHSGDMRERTEWHKVVIFSEGLAGIAEQYLRKGSSVYLEGQLQTRKWTDQQGIEKYVTEIVLKQYQGQLVLLDRAGDSNGTSYAQASARSSRSPANNDYTVAGRQPGAWMFAGSDADGAQDALDREESLDSEEESEFLESLDKKHDGQDFDDDIPF